MTTDGLGSTAIIIHYVMAIYLCIIAIFLVLCLFRAVKGPRVADRVISVNMMGTMVIVVIAGLAFVLNETYLLDICLIYAMISFLAVIVLTKIYTGVYREKIQQEEDKTDAN